MKKFLLNAAIIVGLPLAGAGFGYSADFDEHHMHDEDNSRRNAFWGGLIGAGVVALAYSKTLREEFSDIFETDTSHLRGDVIRDDNLQDYDRLSGIQKLGDILARNKAAEEDEQAKRKALLAQSNMYVPPEEPKSTYVWKGLKS